MSIELEKLKKKEEMERRRDGMVVIVIMTVLAACVAFLYFVPLGNKQWTAASVSPRSPASGKTLTFTGSGAPPGGSQGADTEASEEESAANNSQQQQRTQTNTPQTQASKAQATGSTGQQAALIQELSKIYGEIDNASMYSDGVYRLEYRTNMRTRNEIQREVFNVTRKVRNICRCENIIITAAAGTGQRLLAHSTQETPTRTLSGFLSQADVVWVE